MVAGATGVLGTPVVPRVGPECRFEHEIVHTQHRKTAESHAPEVGLNPKTAVQSVFALLTADGRTGMRGRLVQAPPEMAGESARARAATRLH